MCIGQLGGLAHVPPSCRRLYIDISSAGKLPGRVSGGRSTDHDRVSADSDGGSESVADNPVARGQFGGLCHVGPTAGWLDKNVGGAEPGAEPWIRFSNHHGTPAYPDRVSIVITLRRVRLAQYSRLGHVGPATRRFHKDVGLAVPEISVSAARNRSHGHRISIDGHGETEILTEIAV